jgi:hypothetical protein
MKAIDMKDPRLVCAFHEIGHATVGLLCGLRVRSIELFDAHADGLQALTRYYPNARCTTAYGDLATTLGGPVAESLFTGRDLLAVLNEGAAYAGSDLCRAQREAKRLWKCHLYHSPDYALLIAEQRARTMLEDNWRLIERAALQLCAKGRLD